MPNIELVILRGEILKLSELIMQESFPFCHISDTRICLAASKINDAAHKISKLTLKIPLNTTSN